VHTVAATATASRLVVFSPVWQAGQLSISVVKSIVLRLRHRHDSDTSQFTMVAHLHPRSRSTMSLFSGCLAICFAVVAAPHVLPCPVDKTQLADSASSDGEPRRRRRRKQSAPPPDSDQKDDDDMNNINDMGRPKRECPVPKPSGLIGQVMGFKPHEQRQNPTIIIQTLRDRHNSQDAESSDKSL
jgi:cytochrome c oxidase assembly factor 2